MLTQEFPADKPNQYINWLYLGPASISLLADYKQENERIIVSFQYIQVELGIWKWRKVLSLTLTVNTIWTSVFFFMNWKLTALMNFDVRVLVLWLTENLMHVTYL